MEFQYKGANCLVITTKKAKLVLDDNLGSIGSAGVSKKANISVFTSVDLVKGTDTGEAFVVDGPGEYEISEVSIKGVAARAHMDEDDKKTATIYRFAIGSTMIVALGHVYPEITDTQLEELGMVDILIVPVGGNGYTLDATGAEKMIKKIDPKVVIPTHYEQKGVNYEVPQNPLSDFVTALGVETQKLDKLKIKNDLFSESLTVYELEITK